MSARVGKKAAGREAQRKKRHRRIRNRVQGTGERPRLVVFRSLKYIEGQVIDDDAGRTIVGLATRGSALAGFTPEGANPGVARAREAGRRLAERAVEAGVTKVVFDRAGYQYHGQVQAFAEGAREGGLQF
ncbi:MAG: 50S ribosomal protein L18 [Gemmatimonadetes bacterium]|nr:50S ribosomal protein L18 [Gemmatimonadota bacterium]